MIYMSEVMIIKTGKTLKCQWIKFDKLDANGIL